MGRRWNSDPDTDDHSVCARHYRLILVVKYGRGVIDDIVSGREKSLAPGGNRGTGDRKHRVGVPPAADRCTNRSIQKNVRMLPQGLEPSAGGPAESVRCGREVNSANPGGIQERLSVS